MSADHLAPLATAGRIDRLRTAMAASGTAALLVTKLVNVRYLTGFTGSAGMVLVTADDACFVTDGRYTERAGEEIERAGAPVRVEIGASAVNQRELLRDVAAGAPVALEDHSVTWATQRELADVFGTVEPAGTPVEELRRTKDAGEIDRIRRACAIADETFAEVCELLPSGPTEVEFAIALERGMRERGASGNSFDPIVAAGPNGSRPHHTPGNRPIGRGELVVCDFGCVVDGYSSDMTRTVASGDPGPDARHLYEVVLRSQAAGVAAVTAGVTCAEVDRAARDVIVAEGWGEAFSHSTGHGVGLEIHEAPRVAAAGGDTLRIGDVVTVEPGVYLPGIGGVRIEDTVVVGGAGCEPLTLTPKVLAR